MVARNILLSLTLACVIVGCFSSAVNRLNLSSTNKPPEGQVTEEIKQNGTNRILSSGTGISAMDFSNAWGGSSNHPSGGNHNWGGNYQWNGHKTGGHEGCRYWCRDPSRFGYFVCCNSGVTSNYRCPPVRAQCGYPFRHMPQPQFCKTDRGCYMGQICCFDMCVQRHVCKPPENWRSQWNSGK